MARRKPSSEHEPAEFAARRIALIGAGMAVTLVILSAIIFLATQRRSAERNADVAAGGEVPAPRLQAAPLDDYAHYLAEKRAQLASAAWIDRDHRFAHIPIEQAMDDVARNSGTAKP